MFNKNDRQYLFMFISVKSPVWRDKMELNMEKCKNESVDILVF